MRTVESPGAARRSSPGIARWGHIPCASSSVAVLLCVFVALTARHSEAATWQIVPSLAVRETYTDNVSLSPDASKQTDWITQLIPGISVRATGPQLKFSLSYAPEITNYAQGRQDNTVFQRLDATAKAEIARQLLFVDAGANVNQYNVSLQGPLSASNINTTGNLTTARTLFVSPYLAREFGAAVRGELRFTYSAFDSDDDTSLSNSQANRVNFLLASGPAYKLLTWDLAYLREYVDYESRQDLDTEIVTANVRRLLSSTVGLLGKAGYENYDYRLVGPSSGGSLWSAGLEWTPTPRTRLAATAGERFYGDTYYLDFRHRTRLTTWNAGYTEEITTTSSQFFVPVTTSTAAYLDTLYSSQFPDPEARKKVVDDVIARTRLPASLSAPVEFFTQQLFLVRRWHASAGFLGASNVLLANAYKDTRDAVIGNFVLPSSGDFAASNTIIQTGGSLLWNVRMSALNAWNFGVAVRRDEFPGVNRIDHLLFANVGFSRRFQPRLTGSLNYRRQQNDSDQSQFSYAENAAYATLQASF